MNSSRFILFLNLVLIFVSCGKKKTIEDLVIDEMQSRRGEPALFKLNGVNFSSNKFRDYSFRKSIYFEKKINPIESPEEFKATLNSYINEIILADDILGKVNFNSREYSDYITPYIIQGTLNYYFDKEAGIIDEMYNSNYSSKLINTIGDELSKESEKKDYSKEEERVIKNIIKWRKIQKFKESEAFIKQDTLSKLRSKNKVIILNH